MFASNNSTHYFWHQIVADFVTIIVPQMDFLNGTWDGINQTMSLLDKQSHICKMASKYRVFI